MSAERREFVSWRNEVFAAEAFKAAQDDPDFEERPRRQRQRRPRYYAPGDPEAPDVAEDSDE